jgi:phosphoglucosamine mutase
MQSTGQLAGNAIAVTVMSNKGLDIAMEKAGIAVHRTAVGDRYVFEEMKKHRLVLGGEQSGHLLFLDSSTTGDAIIASLKVLEMMVRRHAPVSDLSEVMHKVPQITRSVRLASKPPLELIPKFKQLLAEVEKELGNAGRVLFRYSGTEPVARITIEGPDASAIRKRAEQMEQMLMAEVSALPKE